MKDDCFAGRLYCSFLREELSRHPVLNSIRTNRILRKVIVVVTFMGWFVLSNHCALGRMAQTVQAKKEHACCHNGTSKRANEPADGKQAMQCCKSLHAVMPGVVKAVAMTPPMSVVAVLASMPTLQAHTDELLLLPSGTGPPPRAASFSELVLHRSLRSHAPPFVA